MDSEIVKLIGLMAAAYPNTQVSRETIKVYESMLRDVPLDILTVSIQQCMAESEFMPTVAKIRNKALELSKPVAPEPLEAWGVVLKAIEKYGFYQSPQFDDPVIARAVECIGWRSLCSAESDTQGVDRAHFSRVYEGILRQAENDRRMIPQAREVSQQIRRMISGRTIDELPETDAA